MFGLWLIDTCWNCGATVWADRNGWCFMGAPNPTAIAIRLLGDPAERYICWPCIDGVPWQERYGPVLSTAEYGTPWLGG